MTTLKWMVGLPLALMVTIASAQQRQQPPTDADVQEAQQARPGQARPAQQQAQQQGLESHVANCLILSNQMELALLQMGQEQAENEELKQLTSKMIQDHEKYVQKLEQFASKQASELKLDSQGSEADRSGETRQRQPLGQVRERRQQRQGQLDAQVQREGQDEQRVEIQREVQTDRPGQAGNRRGIGDALGQRGQGRERGRMQAGGSGMQERLMELEKEGAKQFVQLVKEECQDKEGKEFDQTFVGIQLVGHMAMLAKLNAAEDVGSSEFQQLVREGQESTQEHKEQLKQLMKKIADSGN